MTSVINFDLSIEEPELIDLNFDDDNGFDFNIETAISINNINVNPYGGSYTVTPDNNYQVLSTKDKMLSQNITINPIPNNYGLITWDGSTLTVS